MSPQKLAEAIMVSVPEEMKAACAGETAVEMLRWLDELEQALDRGYVPEAFRVHERLQPVGFGQPHEYVGSHDGSPARICPAWTRKDMP
ncbi:MAG: hypothetical protein PHY16_13105 [Methylobacter sp.]|nr:hypothetical protein [Methylobacter sp.]